MFKLGAFTDEISRDLAYACSVCSEFGVEGAELRNMWETSGQDLTPGQVQDVKKIIADNGMVVASMGSGFGKCNLEDAKEVAEHMDILRRVADIGLELGCNLVRGFAFWDRDQVPEKPWDAMVKAYEPVPGILEEKGVILGLENEAACYVGTAGHTRRFLDLLGCDRVKATWDLANHVQDPQGRDVPAYPDGYELLKKDIVHVHVKDAAPGPDDSMPNCFLGMGICRWPDQLQALKDDGYDGYISLETHVQPERFPPELEERYRAYLVGDGRDGREASSRVCLAWLRDTIEALI